MTLQILAIAAALILLSVLYLAAFLLDDRS
jgi:hypothetical protein